MSEAPPTPGTVILFDAARAPLQPGTYRLTASTQVTVDETDHRMSREQELAIEAPRFSLAPDEIAGVVPPDGAEGSFENRLPQILLRRRILPWERPLDADHLIPEPARSADDPELSGPPPWMALLLFHEDECQILRDLPVSQVVPQSVYARLGAPAARCDAVEAERDLVEAIMPSVQELSLLAHVRQVNVDDRASAAQPGDGWFAAVAGNRLPDRGATSWACLVSLEQRADLVPADPLPSRVSTTDEIERPAPAPPSSPAPGMRERPAIGAERLAPLAPRRVRLVLLHAWRFRCGGAGSFHDLAQALDVGMLGTPDASGKPPVTDTGHLPMTLRGRSGVEERALYRGPLVPYPLTRDELGPYHSADQARRVSPESGAEDISYAAAFELGRLIAASDVRFSQDISRWRRAAFRRAASRDTAAVVRQATDLPASLEARLDSAPAPVAAAAVLGRVAARAAAPRVDGNELLAVKSAIGLDPEAVASSWGLPSAAAATRLLSPSVASSPPTPEPPPPPQVGSLEEAAGDVEALEGLTRAHDALLASARREDER